ncbi:hypothetical protein ABZ876_32590 [Streptomyces sp. NPDC046931]|uniref:8-oxoguanine DNA glycosylase OGG fold protein n=1 Tax=Streptomyces sp. NPDC046931 TaxID=3154806 RepID=UPI0033C8B8E5
MPACPGCSGVGDPVAGTARPGGEVRTTVRRPPPGATGAASQPGITPWPSALAPHSFTGDARVSRAQVTSMVANTLARETLREALVATYVWGKGKSGSPGGSGPTTLHKILAAEDLLDKALDDAVTVLSRHGAVASYEGLRGRIPGFGPSFFTKFLYFAGKTVKPANGPEPLILDRVLARRLRSLAHAVGRETGHDPDGAVAAWVWRDQDWSPHRYKIYLSFMHAAAHQPAATEGWPSDASPDLLEYALFSGAWT